MTQCYECYDDQLFERLGPGEQYNKRRDEYDFEAIEKPFNCQTCGRLVQPGEH